MEGRVEGTGVQLNIANAYGRDLPEFSGEHLWIMISMWRVVPPLGETVHLDMENILNVDGPGCFHCGEPWQEDIGPCKGHMEDE